MVHSCLCPGGGIGRRARFRSVYRKMWRFEFSPGHHRYPNKKKPLSFQRLFFRLHSLLCQLTRVWVSTKPTQGKPYLNRHSHQVMTLRAHNARAGELTHLQGFAQFFWRQQFHDAVDFRRISIAAALAAFAAQRWR